MLLLLPQLIVEILSLLPVKPLCRFKCVSKLWLALIEDPRFIKLHLAKTQRKRLFLEIVEETQIQLRGRKFRQIEVMCLYSLNLEMVSKTTDDVFAVKHDFANPMPKVRCLPCLSSCNGLLCLLTKDCFIYNPSTRETKQIPDVHIKNLLLYGFGYAESINDFKFVKVDNPGKYFDVYSLKNDSWTSIQIDLISKDYESFIEKSYPGGVPLNEAIHWVSEDLKGSFIIIAFDLVDEMFKTLPAPDIMPNEDSMHCLGLLNDCLCLTVQESEFNIHVWVMKEYGNQESWTRILICESFCWLKPLKKFNDSEKILCLSDAQELVFCNPEDTRIEYIEVQGIENRLDDDSSCEELGFGDEGDAEVYVESLFSPNYKYDSTTYASRTMESPETITSLMSSQMRDQDCHQLNV